MLHLQPLYSVKNAHKVSRHISEHSPGLSDAQRLGSHANPSRVQRSHGNLEASPLGAQQAGGWQAAVLKYEVRGGRSSDAKLVLLLAEAEPGCAVERIIRQSGLDCT